MSPEKLLKLANVSERGAVLLGSSTAADGPTSRPVRVVTHIHSDHIIGLGESKRKSRFIVATPATLDMLEALGHRIPGPKKRPVGYGEPLDYEGERITLHRARHVFGAAQVLVELEDGFRIAYTGDFKFPGTPVLMDLDVLVLESTYGRPDWVRPFKDYVEMLFTDLVLEALSRGPVHVYAYHGKLQEAMEILRSNGVDAPFIAPGRIYRLTKIAEKHGLSVGEVLEDGTREAEEVKRSAWYVYFNHMATYRRRRLGNATNVILSGWEFREPLRRINGSTWMVALSDHADFEDLIRYVEESRPKLVLTDAFRDGAAEILAGEIERRLGIPAMPRPRL